MTQREITAQRTAITSYLKDETKTFNKSRKWDCWNYVLNIIRQNQGKPLVSRLNNPYLNEGEKIKMVEVMGIDSEGISTATAQA